jgi:hypothetical protein
MGDPLENCSLASDVAGCFGGLVTMHHAVAAAHCNRVLTGDCPKMLFNVSQGRTVHPAIKIAGDHVVNG